MPCLRVTLDLAFDSNEAGACTRPGAQAKYDALLAAIAAARPFAAWLTADEDGTGANRHLCRHPEGGSCPSPTEVGTRPVKRVAVPAVIGEIEP
jgi:hypothetical protein